MAKISLKHKLEYYFLRVLAALIRRLPREQALVLGGRLGLLAGMLLPKRRRLAEENLQRAFPEWSRRKVATLAWANFQHVGTSSADMLRIDLFDTRRGDLQRYFDLDLDEMRKAHDLGRGVIMLSGHFGFWEVGSFPLQQQGYRVDLVAKPMKNPLVDSYFEKMRKTYGHEVLNSRKGARRIVKALQQGDLVAVLLDQHISPPGSIPVDFFGRKAYTTTAITRLAMKYRIPLVPTFCQRLPDHRYKLWTEPMLLLEGEGEQAVAENTQLLTKIIEKTIRKDPRQWFWMHKRWRVPEQ
ncbi:MAG: lysophospholipid acyltransferase family protein [Deltaproteobacteria bacterium]|nr:lysophospholipid acyltransferase family protein [Deltaproteobacteria bacterium]